MEKSLRDVSCRDLYAWNDTTAFMTTQKLFFKTKKEYYKAQAIGYCLGYYAIKDDQGVKSVSVISATNKKAFIENLKIKNTFYVGDIGAFNELIITQTRNDTGLMRMELIIAWSY